MAAYVKLTWKNNQPPAMSASNLNHIEEGLYQASMDTITGGTVAGSGDNIVITLNTYDPNTTRTFQFDAVAWLSVSAFYTQDYIDSCFEETNITED